MERKGEQETAEAKIEKHKRIWWEASYPKSGSTWVRMFLNAYITKFPPEINSAYQFVSGDLRTGWMQITAAKPVDKFTDTDYLYYRLAALCNQIYLAATPNLCLKTHHALVEAEGLPLIPPRLTKGALYVVRDPRDVAVSFADHMAITIDEAIDQMANKEMAINKDNTPLFHFISSWSAHVDSWTVQNSSIEPTVVVRYEDLRSDPERFFVHVLELMGLPYDPQADSDRLRVAIDHSRFDLLKSQEEKKGFRENGKQRRFFREGVAGGWRNVLSDSQQRRIEEAHRPTMERWKYLAPTRSGALPRVRMQATGVVVKKEERI